LLFPHTNMIYTFNMQGITEDKFVNEINNNIGIIHKICNIYFNNPDDRKDARQEILFHLWKSYPNFKGNSVFSTWMYKVALNTAITFAKKSNRNSVNVTLHEHFNSLSESNEVQSTDEKMTSLYTAINTLSEIDKAITLLYLEDKSYDEIAAITGLTKSNVSVRLVRIKNNLKEKLKNIN
jgi:RNA polymerase sigma-70 factor, ECF subfamily